MLLPEVQCRVSVEAGSTFGWVKYTGPKGTNIGIDDFGASAPGEHARQPCQLVLEVENSHLAGLRLLLVHLRLAQLAAHLPTSCLCCCTK